MSCADARESLNVCARAPRKVFCGIVCGSQFSRPLHFHAHAPYLSKRMSGGLPAIDPATYFATAALPSALPSPPPPPPPPPGIDADGKKKRSRPRSTQLPPPAAAAAVAAPTTAAVRREPVNPRGTLRASRCPAGPLELKRYYGTFFPLAAVHALLHRGKAVPLAREFAYDLADRDCAMIRFKTANTVDELKAALTSDRPSVTAIHAGSVATQCREVTFDIDMDSTYDALRADACGCQGTSVCNTCIRILHMGIRIAEEVMRSDFQFSKTMIEFSGRRGFHLTILDDAAFALSSDARSALVGYLSFAVGNNNDAEPVHSKLAKALRETRGLLVPSLMFYRAFRAHVSEFARVFMYEGKLFATEQGFRRVLAEAHVETLVKHADGTDTVDYLWSETRALRRELVQARIQFRNHRRRVKKLKKAAKRSGSGAVPPLSVATVAVTGDALDDEDDRKQRDGSEEEKEDARMDDDAQKQRSLERWWQFVRVCSAVSVTDNAKHFTNVMTTLVVIVLSRIWPTLDAKVTSTINHLCRASFSFHPKSQSFCMPLVPGAPIELEHVPVLSDFLLPSTPAQLSSAVAAFAASAAVVSAHVLR